MPDSHRCIWVWQYCPTQICLTGSASILCGWLGDARLVGVGFHTFAYIRLIKMIAYAIRVMLAHVRIKQAAFIKNTQASNDSPELQALYALFVAQPSETSTPRAASSISNILSPVSSKMTMMSSKMKMMSSKKTHKMTK